MLKKKLFKFGWVLHDINSHDKSMGEISAAKVDNKD